MTPGVVLFALNKPSHSTTTPQSLTIPAPLSHLPRDFHPRLLNSININETSELLFVDLRLRHGPVMFGLYYRPPSSQPTSLSDLETALESIPPASMKNFVLVGDFNINLLQPDSPSTIELTNITSSFHLSQVVNSPTRETDHSATLIDHGPPPPL